MDENCYYLIPVVPMFISLLYILSDIRERKRKEKIMKSQGLDQDGSEFT
jgi:hypothetical protein